ncbi:hypothetical protein Tco_1328811 [Tanacetum coccineum]
MRYLPVYGQVFQCMDALLGDYSFGSRFSYFYRQGRFALQFICYDKSLRQGKILPRMFQVKMESFCVKCQKVVAVTHRYLKHAVDENTSFLLKSVTSILLSGFDRVAIPLVGKNWQLLKADSSLFTTTKAFAAGVSSLQVWCTCYQMPHRCYLTLVFLKIPWSNFHFSGFITMMAALTTLLDDFITTVL